MSLTPITEQPISGDFYSIAGHNIEAMGRDLEGQTYRGIPVFHFLKMITYLHMHSRYLNQQGARLPKWKALAWQVVRQLWCPDRTGPAARFASADADFIMSLDHDHPNLNPVMLRLAAELGEQRVFMLTSSRRIEAEIKGGFAGPCYTPSLERVVRFKAKHIRVLKAVYRSTPFFRKEDWVFTLSCFFDALTAMKLYDFFLAHLDPAHCRAILTLLDTHPPELALTAAACAKGIPTFTLQHGIVGVMYTPVHSDRIFVWGEATKQDLLQLGVPEEKIVISGRPLLDEAAVKYKALELSLRTSFRARHPRSGSSGPVVTYIVGNIGTNEERALLTTFSATWNLGILPVVRLKPGLDKEQEQQFRDWINELGGSSEVHVSISDDLYELLAVSDVVIGFYSSVVVEALAFDCIPVLLDTLPEYDLRSLNPHYGDCLSVRDAEELGRLILRLSEDPDYFQHLKEVYAARATRYFGGEPGVPATRFIRDYIVKFAAQQVQGVS